jgi:hypothetical protein
VTNIFGEIRIGCLREQKVNFSGYKAVFRESGEAANGNRFVVYQIVTK